MHSAHAPSIEEVKVVNRFKRATALLISVQDADADAACGVCALARQL